MTHVSALTKVIIVNRNRLIFISCLIINLIYINDSIPNICDRFSIGVGRLGGKNTAPLITSNLMAQFPINEHHSIAITYYNGEEIYFVGVDAPFYNSHELKEVEKYREIGLLYYYDFVPINSPHIGLGLSYFKGFKRNNELINKISIPFDIGLNIQIYRVFSLGISFIGSLNNYTLIKGVIFSIILTDLN
jgi:hypothetical protein